MARNTGKFICNTSLDDYLQVPDFIKSLMELSAIDIEISKSMNTIIIRFMIEVEDMQNLSYITEYFFSMENEFGVDITIEELTHEF